MAKHFHIMANQGDIAQTVLLPGDPLRAKFIAENFLENPKQYNSVRNMLGYTGTYKGKKVSVQGTGMGIPSISIYVNELIDVYKAKNLIRIGTCGTISENVKVKEVILAMGACTTSNVNLRRFKGLSFAPIADFNLLSKAYEVCKSNSIKAHVGNVLTSDLFYDDAGEGLDIWKNHDILGVEMETAELYTLAKAKKVNALSILTVSDNILTGDATSPEEREKTFKDMMNIALEIA